MLHSCGQMRVEIAQRFQMRGGSEETGETEPVLSPNLEPVLIEGDSIANKLAPILVPLRVTHSAYF